jgi:hypothetical protein
MVIGRGHRMIKSVDNPVRAAHAGLEDRHAATAVPGRTRKELARQGVVL